MRIVFFIYCLLCLVLLFLLAGPFMIICALVNRDWSINLVYLLLRYIARLWLALTFFKFRIMGPQRVSRKQRIIIANHSSYLDILTALASIRGPYRVLGKSSIGRLPFLGFFYRRIVVSVDRIDSGNRAWSVRILNKVLAKGYSVFIFPEGTFNESGAVFKAFYDGAFKLAIARQIELQPLLFPDNLGRMHYESILSVNPGLVRAFFPDAVPVTGYNSHQTDVLKNDAINVMEKAWSFMKRQQPGFNK